MNQHEAKFLLRAFRPDGKDTQDPVFTEALAQAESDPRLKAWLDRETAFDRALRTKLAEVQPPAGLREAILAGSRASRPVARSGWRNPTWFALAAALAVAAVIGLRFRPVSPTAREFAEFALHDLANAHAAHEGERTEFKPLQKRLAAMPLPLPTHLKLDPREMGQVGCRVVSFVGRDVFEVCFEREGKLFHLYAARGNLRDRRSVPADLAMTEGHFDATAWQEGEYAYALVTYDGPAALQLLL